MIKLDLVEQENFYNSLFMQIQNSLKERTEYPLYSDDWLQMAPSAPGIYFVFHLNEIVYVGESANLKKRMKDLRNTYNHTLRRKLGKALFQNHEHYSISSSVKKYHPSIEEAITKYALDNLKVTYFELKIGRKEMESAFINGPKLPIYNSRSVR
ncbi:hypothetical protein CQS04_07220 [Chryseomicrobium excrementi]|uniref:GIY-YIG domain-containing protein n=1 Tax=Chryseomicrobium excrementi TaxID=2041346 RepID=A0A2M9F0E9_9BACL|nr:GIY-YIG nuclease family protein [Chryseomicrobium excrementi]PJK16937.1 hypothetical protein CQS04_07220 [Chryseomicrobium excrementi]